MSRLLHRPRLSKATPTEVENRDPAASMSLLLDAMRHPIDPLYEDVAHRKITRQEMAASSSRRTVEIAVVVLITLTLGFLIGSAVTALRVPKKVSNDARAQLIKQIEARRDANDKKLDSVAAQREGLATSRARALAGTSQNDLKVGVTRAESLAGLATSSGAGIELKLSNSEGPGSGADDSDPRTAGSAQALTSSDLQRVINGLWQAGATDIAVNDQRLTSLSAVRFAGSAILVNYRPLTAPYRVRALGPRSLGQYFRASDGGRYLTTLQQHGIETEVEQRSRMDLPSGAAPTARYARVSK